MSAASWMLFFLERELGEVLMTIRSEEASIGLSIESLVTGGIDRREVER